MSNAMEAPRMAKKDEDLGDDFSYIIRMSDTDVDGLRPLASALTAINGVGDRTAIQICRQTGFEPTRLAGHLTADEQQTLMKAVEDYAEKVPLWMLNRQRDIESGEELHLTGQQVKLVQKDDIDRLRAIKAYRGVRHANRQKVRGQRGRSNGRFGLTLGVQRKK